MDGFWEVASGPMCVFITIGVPKNKHQDLIHLVDRRFGLPPLREEAIRALFPSTDVCLLITRGGCSCDLYREEISSEEDGGSWSAEKDRKLAIRTRRKGWSEAKITRAIEDRMRTREKKFSVGWFSQFRDMIPQLAERCGTVRLYAREYGTPEQDALPFNAGRLDLTAAEFLQRGGGYPLDHLVTIRR